MKVTTANYLEFLNQVRQAKNGINSNPNLSPAGKDTELEKLDMEIKDAINQLNNEARANTHEQQKKLNEMKRPGRFLPKQDNRHLQAYLGDVLLSEISANAFTPDRLVDVVKSFVNEGPDQRETFLRIFHKVNDIANAMDQETGMKIRKIYHETAEGSSTSEQRSFDQKQKELNAEINKLNATVYTARELLTREVVDKGPWKRTE